MSNKKYNMMRQKNSQKGARAGSAKSKQPVEMEVPVHFELIRTFILRYIGNVCVVQAEKRFNDQGADMPLENIYSECLKSYVYNLKTSMGYRNQFESLLNYFRQYQDSTNLFYKSHRDLNLALSKYLAPSDTKLKYSEREMLVRKFFLKFVTEFVSHMLSHNYHIEITKLVKTKKNFSRMQNKLKMELLMLMNSARRDIFHSFISDDSTKITRRRLVMAIEKLTIYKTQLEASLKKKDAENAKLKVLLIKMHKAYDKLKHDRETAAVEVPPAIPPSYAAQPNVSATQSNPPPIQPQQLSAPVHQPYPSYVPPPVPLSQPIQEIDDTGDSASDSAEDDDENVDKSAEENAQQILNFVESEAKEEKSEPEISLAEALDKKVSSDRAKSVLGDSDLITINTDAMKKHASEWKKL